MGRNAVLVDDLTVSPAVWAAAAVDRLGPQVIELVPAATTVLIVVDDPGRLDAVIDAARAVDPTRLAGGTELGPTFEIPVSYDGPDVADVAAATGLTADEVVDLHAAAVYRVEFCGFAPGFAYLSGLPAALHVSRRSTPRTRVPAGSVAIAAGYSAVYPTSSPGGWHLIGRTEMTMFDPSRSPPALLAPGMPVRFVPA